MFGTNKFKKIKSKTFKNDNDRKKYFAIKNYYKNKDLSNIVVIKKRKEK